MGKQALLTSAGSGIGHHICATILFYFILFIKTKKKANYTPSLLQKASEISLVD
jgi:hypothetical protein